ncbi:DNA primase TraC [Symmachiella macrocystis]|uniref:DNA primase TraC n=1 Tax=Symmachiella macrocystis TaxID=2527985 RepID=A0A5C6BB33_9PLAN|nr:zincin-like metallopeptidase domain-containing protein [Symmachiella macrocystis]TWU08882.1 DNA primase TraC [Symmachiella macrocystis]
MPTNNQVRHDITNRIIESIESGSLPPWRRTWRQCPNSGWATNVVSRMPYTGVNPILCMIASMKYGFQSKQWATFRQWKALNGQVMKRPEGIEPGKWGTRIVFAKPITKTKTDTHGDEVEEKFFILKQYTVFNIDQVEGDHLNHLRAGCEQDTRTEFERLEHAEEVFSATGADIRHGGNHCYFSPADDYIQMPERERFDREYYESLSHEFIHWSLNERRLNWKAASNARAQQYAEEELVAEIGACFLANEIGIPITESLDNHSAYLNGWLERMKGDSSYIFRASSAASKATDFIMSFNRTKDDASTAGADTPVVVMS